MSFPAGISLATITVGSVIDFFGESADITVTVAPVLGGDGKAKHIVHADTGHVMLLRRMTFSGSPSGPVSFDVPHTDQPGFVTSAGETIQDWAYSATVVYGKGKDENWTKVFQPKVGQNLLDLDLIPDGNITAPVTAPMASVTSVNGDTGAVTLLEATPETIEAGLPLRLSEAELSSTTASAISTAAAKRAKVSDGIFAAVDEALNGGRSAALQLQGDSTGNADYEWFRLMTMWLAGGHSSAHVKSKLWDDAAQRHGAWTVLQAGASGERHAYFTDNSRTFYQPVGNIPAITGDIDVRVRLAADNWASGANQTLVARYGAAGQRSWNLGLNSIGRVFFNWSPDGTNLVSGVSSSSPAVSAGQELWVRGTLDVDNGNGGRTVTLYSSTDGIAWTQLGQSASTDGITSIFDPGNYHHEIGGRGLAGEVTKGKFYEVQIRDGIDGKIINPQPIDSWVPRPASGSAITGTFGGSPTLYVLNGSHPGANYTYFADATRHPKMVHPYTGSLVFQSCSHNDNENTGPAYLAARDNWLALTDARAPGSQIVLVTQNPETAPIEAHNIHNHARRRTLLMAWAARKGLSVVDTYKAFLDDPRGLAVLLETDGIHPNVEGSKVWAAAVQDAFAAAL